MSRAKLIKPESFFEFYAGNKSFTEIAEDVYIITHTLYLRECQNLKTILDEAFNEHFGKDLFEEGYTYLKMNNPVMMRPAMMNAVKSGEAIHHTERLKKSLVELEFDLWIMDSYETDRFMNFDGFKTHLSDKYPNGFSRVIENFNKFDLLYIEDLRPLAKGLLPHKEEIKEFYQQFLSSNQAFFTSLNSKKAASTPCDDSNDLIRSLKADIEEYKQQVEYYKQLAVSEYDRGVRDLFSQMNSISYDKVMDGLFRLKDEDDEEAMIYFYCYLENLFEALKEFGLSAIMTGLTGEIKEDSLLKDFTCTFDRKSFDPKKVTLKYHGWRYKDRILEKPTISLKEDN